MSKLLARATRFLHTYRMCNLYSLTKGQAAIRDWFRARHDHTGNLPLFPGIFPDQMAPVVRVGADGNRELFMARWGMPGPLQYGAAPVTNIRNVQQPSLARMARQAKPLPRPGDLVLRVRRHKATQDANVVRAFAGLWASWRGVRGPKSAPVEGHHELFGFLTTEANATVAPIHPKAMPGPAKPPDCRNSGSMLRLPRYKEHWLGQWPSPSVG